MCLYDAWQYKTRLVPQLPETQSVSDRNEKRKKGHEAMPNTKRKIPRLGGKKEKKENVQRADRGSQEKNNRNPLFFFRLKKMYLKKEDMDMEVECLCLY